MTTLPEPVQEERRQPPPSPWSAPRPDGPLAAALRCAQAARSAAETGPPAGALEETAPLPPDLQPLAPPAAPNPHILEHDIEALAREAQSRDSVREALAIALEWPAGTAEREEMRAWRGWIALGATLALAGAAAAIALALAWDEVPPQTGHGDLKLERELQMPRASSPGASVR